MCALEQQYGAVEPTIIHIEGSEACVPLNISMRALVP